MTLESAELMPDQHQVGCTCIVVADGGRARVFLLEASEAPRGAPFSLVERGVLNNPDLRSRGFSAIGRPPTETNTDRDAAPVHPMGAQRERHGIELERRFAMEIARKTAALVESWSDGVVVLVADPRMLGLLRDSVRNALKPAVHVKELAKDYAHLTAAELYDHLALNGLVPAPRGGDTR